MSARNAAPGAAASATAAARSDPGPDDSGRRSSALAVLDAYRRDNLLEAVALAARELLRSSDLAVSLPKVIEQIGPAAGVDRAHILLFDMAGDYGEILHHHLWAVPGIATPPMFQNAKAPMSEVGLKSWVPRLAGGETIVGHVREFDPVVRAFFELGGVKSTLCVPVFADGQWLGMIAFDDCHSERDWSATEIDTIKTIAELVGAAVARTMHLQKLDDANRIIENSATILYRVGPQPPYPLTFLSQNISRYGYRADELLAHRGDLFDASVDRIGAARADHRRKVRLALDAFDVVVGDHRHGAALNGVSRSVRRRGRKTSGLRAGSGSRFPGGRRSRSFRGR